METVKLEIEFPDWYITELKEIFENEPDFQPMSNKDTVIINLMKKIIEKFDSQHKE